MAYLLARLGLADALRAAGLAVVECDGWQTRGHGDLVALDGVVGHHDASPPGDSPGALRWILDGFRQLHDPGDAQIWIDRQGTIHLAAAGKAWHAGKVNDRRYANERSVGIETDHTNGEEWPPALLAAFRGCVAVLLRLGGEPATSYNFHKHVGIPLGRKTDPDGLTLATERAAVLALLTGPRTAPAHAVAAAIKADPALVAKHAGDLARETCWGACPLPAGHWYGPESKDGRVHSGKLVADERAVRQIQRTVGVTADGYYGPATKAAVAKWQAAHGLAADGLFGAASWAVAAR